MAFYPGAFTGVCDTEMCTLQDNLNAFNGFNATVLGISVDSPWANGGFSKKYNLGFDLLSDLDREVIKSYDVVFEGLGGIEGYTCVSNHWPHWGTWTQEQMSSQTTTSVSRKGLAS